ncbi:MAG: hypothetical protein MHM6MM_001445 [Cercozoa sp. M6MM]
MLNRVWTRCVQRFRPMAQEQIDSIVKQLQELQTTLANEGVSATLPNVDAAFRPLVPPGHTPFSWMGEGSAAIFGAVPAAPVTEKKVKKEKKHDKKDKKDKKKKDKKDKKPKKKAAAKVEVPTFARYDFRVGRIVEVEDHPDADKMFVEKIDCGEAEPRTICSGLKGKIEKEALQGALCIVFANAKPSKLRGIMSAGMVMCAKNDESLELVTPPADAQVGERVSFEGLDFADFEAGEQNLKKKNSPWAKEMSLFKTNGDAEATYDGKRFLTTAGPCKVSASLADCPVA